MSQPPKRVTNWTLKKAELGPDSNAKGMKQNVQTVWNSAEEVTDLKFSFSINVTKAEKNKPCRAKKTHCTSQQDILTWQDIKNTRNIHSVHCLNIIHVMVNFILLGLLLRECIKAWWHFHVTSCLNNMVVKLFFFNAICGVLGPKEILLNSWAKPKKAGALSEAFATLRTADVPAQGGHWFIPKFHYKSVIWRMRYWKQILDLIEHKRFANFQDWAESYEIQHPLNIISLNRLQERVLMILLLRLSQQIPRKDQYNCYS